MHSKLPLSYLTEKGTSVSLIAGHDEDPCIGVLEMKINIVKSILGYTNSTAGV